MLFATRVSKSPLRRVSRPGFNPTSVSSTRTILILRSSSSSSPYSTSASDSNKTPSSTLPPLPDQSEWRTTFNPPGASVGLRERISVRNPKTAEILAEGFTKWTKPLLKGGKTEEEGYVAKGAPKVIIEAFPGPGALTRALLALPRDRFDKLIVLEEQPGYLDYLKPLEQADDRVKVLPYNGYSWDTYTMLDEQGWLDDVPRVPWEDGVHPTLQFISHIPHSVTGEQLVNQFLRCIPDKTWLFKYGRVPLNLVMGERLWERSSAGPTHSARCKLSVIADASAELSLNLPVKSLLPYEEHFHPTLVRTKPVILKSDNRSVGHSMVGVNVLPHEQQIITEGMLEKWDYCLRRLYVLKGQSLKTAIGSLAPGAQSLLKPLTDPNLPPEQRVDIKKQIRRMDIRDWALIIRAFNNWPFAPEDLLIHDTYNPTSRNGTLP